MSDVEKEESDNQEELKKKRQKEKPARKTQGQVIQEALGLNPTDIQEIEKKLFIVRFLDFFSEDTLEFIYKERIMGQNIERLTTYMNDLQIEREEEKLLKQSFESKNIVSIIQNVNNKAEEYAVSKGIKTNVNKRLRRLTLYITLPIFVILTLLTIFPIFANLYFVFFPILCLVCLLPQLIRGSIVKKWFQFKEQNKNEIYTENRDDIMILKSFAGELLSNIRSRLLELEVPLQLIKFTLFSRDYENLNLLNQRSIRGFMQYFFTFDYPPDMEPIPIPENLKRYQQDIAPEKRIEKPEKNFIILTEMKGSNGIIDYFVPTLKDTQADKINELLNECEFSKSPNDFKTIIPNYSETLAIYCVCGEIAEIDNIQICNWKNQFKFYLFEGKECKCEESIYVLSLMDESTEIPEEFKDIF
ncbi:MAG: hypothetical protein ACFE8B_00195 [Candidatus Hermodarchaeota archaeon]